MNDKDIKAARRAKRRATILDVLSGPAGGEIIDPSGKATSILIDLGGDTWDNYIRAGIGGKTKHVLNELDVLEADGLIEREKNTRRTHLIRLTPAGWAAAAGGPTPEPLAPLDQEHVTQHDAAAIAAALLAQVVAIAQRPAPPAEPAAAPTAALEEELTEARNTIAFLNETLDRVTAKYDEAAAQNERLQANIQAVLNARRNGSKTPIAELISDEERAALDRLMRELPATRG